MRVLILLVAVLLVASCSGGKIGIKDAGADNELKDVSIKTTQVEVYGEEAEQNPSLGISYPKDGQLIKNSTVAVQLEAYNFSIIPVGSPVRERQGHFHVWLDSEKKIAAENFVAFDNIGSGKHTLTAELVKSNHSSLSPKVARTVTFNVEVPAAEKEVPGNVSSGYSSEYIIEADDYGFYPNKIRVKIGDNVTISFKFRDHLIYYCGLDVTGPFPDIKYGTGDEQPIIRKFIMLEETIIKSFWPSTGVKKAELMVEVEK